MTTVPEYVKLLTIASNEEIPCPARHAKLCMCRAAFCVRTVFSFGWESKKGKTEQCDLRCICNWN